MRVVVDTNVLVSALIKPEGRLGPVLLHLRDGAYTLLYTDASLEELVDVLNRSRLRRKYRLSNEDVKTALRLILLRGEAVAPTRRIAVCRDPKDDKFLEIAIAGDADLIVTGDKDLLALDPFENIPIIEPRAFLQRLASL